MKHQRFLPSPTLLLVYSKNDHHFVSADPDELLDTSDTTTGQFGEEDHAVNVVVLEQLDVGAHLGDLVSQLEVGLLRSRGVPAGQTCCDEPA